MKNDTEKLIVVSPYFINNDQSPDFPLYSQDGILLANKKHKPDEINIPLLLNQKKLFTRLPELLISLETLQFDEQNQSTRNNQPYRFSHVFQRIAKIERVLIESVFSDRTNFQVDCYSIANNLESLVRNEPDGSIAKIMLRSNRYCVIEYAITSAIIATILCNAFHWKTSEKKRFIAATLSQIIPCIFESNDTPTLSDGKTPPFNSREFNKAAFNLLHKKGVKDKKWLDYILKHFQQNQTLRDLEESNISFSQSLFNFVTNFSSLLTGFGQFQRNYPHIIYNKILEEFNCRYKELFLKTLITKLGQYPVGSIVKLQNREVAIVTHQGAKIDTPVVRTIIANTGLPTRHMPERQANNGNHKITSIMYSADIINRLDFSLLWRN